MSTAFLRWAGSKRKLLPKLLKHWNESHKRYIEPFVGSAQFFFYVSPETSIISDVNEELINAYLQVRDNTQELHSSLSKIKATEKQYYDLRSRETSELTPLERGVRFIFLNRYCFNGIYRTNKLGKFNVPYSNINTGNIPSLDHLQECSLKLKNTIIEVGDFEVVVRKHVTYGDFVYLDPPYAVQNERIFNQYNAQTFGLQDIDRLAGLLEFLNSNDVKFLLSYANCAEAREVFKRWGQDIVTTQRNVAGFSKHRRIAEELFIYN